MSSADEFLTAPVPDVVPPTATQIEQFYRLTPVPTEGDGRIERALPRCHPVVEDERLLPLEPVIDNLQKDAPPPAGITVAPGGIGVVSVGLLENLAKSRALLTYLALLFVGAFLALRLRSLVRSLLSLIPVLIAVGAVTLLALALHVTLSPLTAVSGPLVVAVCTEFTSLILLQVRRGAPTALAPRNAMTVTASRTGRAFMVSGMTAFAGIAVVATSTMPMLRDFGIVMALNVAVALLSALIVLPPVLVWAEETGGWVSRGLLKPVPAPIEFSTDSGGPVGHPTSKGDAADNRRSDEQVPAHADPMNPMA